ncbi:MAG: DUF4238 domain-containing protein [Candidatus Shapirobacteria bacterium]|nr:DUF4238 domain-containing protein [Candidatus Shapirobacteria bacterium]
MPNDQIKSFHHYVPKFLLEYFSENGKLWVYDRKNNEYRLQPIISTTGDKAFYTFMDKDGNKSDEIEKLFTQIEGNAATVIRSINTDKKTLTPKEKSDLALFVTATYLRTPEFIENNKKSYELLAKEVMSMIHTNKEYHDHVWDELIRTGKIPKDSKGKEKTRQVFIKKDYDLIVPKEHSLSMMVKLIFDSYRYIVQMEWKILIAPPKKAFITSDKPAYTANINPTDDFYGNSIGLFAPGCETFCVLTPQVAVYLSQTHNPNVADIYEAKEEFVDFLNKTTAITCYRFLLSHSQLLLKKWVEKTKLKTRGVYHKVIVDSG